MDASVAKAKISPKEILNSSSLAKTFPPPVICDSYFKLILKYSPSTKPIKTTTKASNENSSLGWYFMQWSYSLSHF